MKRLVLFLVLGHFLIACSPATITVPNVEISRPACFGAYLQDHQNPAGAKILSIQTGGPLYLARIRENDVIVAINGVATPSAGSVRYELSRYNPGAVVVVRHARQRLYGLYWDYFDSPTRLGLQSSDGVCVSR